MAAKLTWSGYTLMLGPWPMAHIKQLGPTWWFWSVTAPNISKGGDYECFADAQQDCETEVRRLLKEAGCEVDP